jgi:hypothetical protein
VCCLARAFPRMLGDADDQHRGEIAAVLSPSEPLARFPVMWNRSRIRSFPRERDHQVPTHGPGSRPFRISPSPNIRAAQQALFDPANAILAGPDIAGARRVDSEQQRQRANPSPILTPATSAGVGGHVPFADVLLSQLIKMVTGVGNKDRPFSFKQIMVNKSTRIRARVGGSSTLPGVAYIEPPAPLRTSSGASL